MVVIIKIIMLIWIIIAMIKSRIWMKKGIFKFFVMCKNGWMLYSRSWNNFHKKILLERDWKMQMSWFFCTLFHYTTRFCIPQNTYCNGTTIRILIFIVWHYICYNTAHTLATKTKVKSYINRYCSYNHTTNAVKIPIVRINVLNCIW